MARGVNKVILIGNLGNDAEVRYTPNGSAVATISLATSESWRDKQTGDLQERTEWHRVVFFNRLAEIVGEYLRKGAKIYVEGSLRTRKWQDKNGVDRYTTEIIANEMHMLDGRPSNSAGNHKDKHTHHNKAPHHDNKTHEETFESSSNIESENLSKQTQKQDNKETKYLDDDDIPF